MLKLILEMLPLLKEQDSEAIAIAKGKYKMPENFKELKQTIKWQLRKQ
jgi:hypothetical protein